MATSKHVPDDLKVAIRSVLLSTKGVKVERFMKDFRNFMGYHIQCRDYGFRDIAELIASIPDVARIEFSQREETHILYGIAAPNTYISQALKKNEGSPQLDYSSDGGVKPEELRDSLMKKREAPRSNSRGRGRGGRGGSNGRGRGSDRAARSQDSPWRRSDPPQKRMSPQKTEPPVPGEEAEMYRKQLKPNLKNLYAICFPRNTHTREEVVEVFGKVGEIAETSAAGKHYFIRYYDREHAIRALLKHKKDYYVTIPEEHTQPRHVIKENITSTRPKSGDDKAVYIGNLPENITEKEVSDLVRDIDIKDVRLVLKDGKRFGFISVFTLKDAEETIHQLKLREVQGKRLVAQMAYQDGKLGRHNASGHGQSEKELLHSMTIAAVPAQVTVALGDRDEDEHFRAQAGALECGGYDDMPELEDVEEPCCDAEEEGTGQLTHLMKDMSVNDSQAEIKHETVGQQAVRHRSSHDTSDQTSSQAPVCSPSVEQGVQRMCAHKPIHHPQVTRLGRGQMVPPPSSSAASVAPGLMGPRPAGPGLIGPHPMVPGLLAPGFVSAGPGLSVVVPVYTDLSVPGSGTHMPLLSPQSYVQPTEVPGSPSIADEVAHVIKGIRASQYNKEAKMPSPQKHTQPLQQLPEMTQRYGQQPVTPKPGLLPTPTTIRPGIHNNVPNDMGQPDMHNRTYGPHHHHDQAHPGGSQYYHSPSMGHGTHHGVPHAHQNPSYEQGTPTVRHGLQHGASHAHGPPTPQHGIVRPHHPPGTSHGMVHGHHPHTHSHPHGASPHDVFDSPHHHDNVHPHKALGIPHQFNRPHERPGHGMDQSLLNQDVTPTWNGVPGTFGALQVSNFPFGTTKEELEQLFAFSEPVKVFLKVIHQWECSRAVVLYDTLERLRRGLELDGTMYRSCQLQVCLTDKTIKYHPELIKQTRIHTSPSHDAGDRRIVQMENGSFEDLRLSQHLWEDATHALHGPGGDNAGDSFSRAKSFEHRAVSPPGVVSHRHHVGAHGDDPHMENVEQGLDSHRASARSTTTEITLQTTAEWMSRDCFPDTVALYTCDDLEEEICIMVICVVDDLHFWGWVVSEDNLPDLTELLDNMTMVDDVGMALSEGETRCAAYHKGEWYRAHICEMWTDRVLVFFVDYGNEEIVPRANLVALPEDYWEMAPQAVPFRIMENTAGSIRRNEEHVARAVCVQHNTEQVNVIKVCLIEWVEEEEHGYGQPRGILKDRQKMNVREGLKIKKNVSFS